MCCPSVNCPSLVGVVVVLIGYQPAVAPGHVEQRCGHPGGPGVQEHTTNWLESLFHHV